VRQNCLRSTTRWFPSVPLKELRPYGRYTAWPQLGLPGVRCRHHEINAPTNRAFRLSANILRMVVACVSIIEQKPLAKWCSEKRPTLNVQMRKEFALSVDNLGTCCR